MKVPTGALSYIRRDTRDNRGCDKYYFFTTALSYVYFDMLLVDSQ